MKYQLFVLVLLVPVLTACYSEKKKLLTAVESAAYFEDNCLRKNTKERGDKWNGRISARKNVGDECTFHNENLGKAFSNAMLNGVDRDEIKNARKRGEKASEIENAK